jgi:hypothetical protein
VTKLIQDLVRRAERLPPAERELLAGELIARAESAPLTEVDVAWVAEAEARYDAWKAGRTKTVDAAKATQAIRHRLRRGTGISHEHTR